MTSRWSSSYPTCLNPSLYIPTLPPPPPPSPPPFPTASSLTLVSLFAGDGEVLQGTRGAVDPGVEGGVRQLSPAKKARQKGQALRRPIHRRSLI